MELIPSIKPLFVQPFDEEAWCCMSGDHLHVRIGNARVTTDQRDSLRSIRDLMDRVEEFGADYCDALSATTVSYVETDIRFFDARGQRRSIPCAMTARFAAGQLIDLRIHLDPSPIPGYPSLSEAARQDRTLVRCHRHPAHESLHLKTIQQGMKPKSGV